MRNKVVILRNELTLRDVNHNKTTITKLQLKRKIETTVREAWSLMNDL